MAEEIKEAVATAEKANVELKGDAKKVMEMVEKMTVLELSELVKAMEVKFGVSAAAPVMMAQGGASAGAPEAVEEKSAYDVVLKAAGAQKIAVIKALRELVPTLGLKEAKDLVDAAPKEVMGQVNKKTAEEAKEKLTAAGATVELK